MANSYELIAFVLMLSSAILLFIIQLRNKLTLFPFTSKEQLLSNLGKVDKIIACIALIMFVLGFISLMLSM